MRRYAVNILSLTALWLTVQFSARGEEAKSAPTTGNTNRPPAFNAEMSADFMRRVMETSAKIEGIKRQIAERRGQLYETNAEIKKHREAMIALQKKINAILEADEELARLTMERDIIWTTMPALPRRPQGGMPQGLMMPMRGQP